CQTDHPCRRSPPPVYTLSPQQRLASAHAVFLGPRGAVTTLARDRDCSRQALYRQADAVAAALDGTQAARRRAELQSRLAEVEGRLADTQAQLRLAVVLDDDRQAEFVATAQAQGVSLSATRALLAVLL